MAISRNPEAAEQQRLLARWAAGDLTQEEIALLPAGLRERTRVELSGLVGEGLRSGEEKGWIDGPAAMRRLRVRLQGRAQERP